MSVFNFTENKATSVPINPDKLEFNTGIINRHCQRLCLFNKECQPTITPTENSTIEVTGKKGIIGQKTETSRCLLPSFVLDNQGFMSVDLSLRDES